MQVVRDLSEEGGAEWQFASNYGQWKQEDNLSTVQELTET